VTSKSFNLSVLLDYLPHHIDQSEKFRNWYHRGETMFIKNVEVFDKNPPLKQFAIAGQTKR
jgi:hypothetical protein